MRNFTVLIFSLLLCVSPLFSQDKYEISGFVSDKVTADPLPGTYVIVVGTQTGTSTDGDGKYKFKLAPGTYQLTTSFISYRADTVTVTIEPNNDNFHDFLLEPQFVVGDEIVVSAGRVANRVRELARIRQKEKKGLENYSALVHKMAVIYETRPGSVFSQPEELEAIAFSERMVRQMYVAPRSFGEQFLARRASDNFFSEYDFFSTGGSPLDLNQEKVELSLLSENVSVVGPISVNARKFYFLDDEPADSTWPAGTTKILVKPKQDNTPLFEGCVFVNDDANGVIGMDLHMNAAGEVFNGLYSLSDFRYYQKFKKKKGFWVPERTEIEGRIGILGMKKDLIYRDLWTYADYSMNLENLKRKDIPLSGQSTIEGVDDRDSLFWEQALYYAQESDVSELQEALSYEEKRALVNVGVASFRAYVKLPYTLQNFYMTNVSDFYRFNRVEGHYVGIGVRTPSKNGDYYYKGAIGYATDPGAQDLRYYAEAMQFIPGTPIAVEGGVYNRLALQFLDYEYNNNPLNLDELRYTIFQGFAGLDPRNYFEREGYKAGLRLRFGRDFFFRVNYMREDHKFLPLVTTRSFFSDFEVGDQVDPQLADEVGLTPDGLIGSDGLPSFTEGEFSGLEFHFHFDNRQFNRYGFLRNYNVRQFGWFTDQLAYWSDPDFGASKRDGFKYFKYRSSFGLNAPVFTSHFIRSEIFIGGSDSPLPAQMQFAKNGFMTDDYLRHRPFTTLGFNEGVGNRVSVARLRYDFGSGFVRLFPFRAIRQSGMRLEVFGAGGITHPDDDLSPVLPWTDGLEEHIEAGFALTKILGIFKLETAIRLVGDKGTAYGFVLIF